MRVFEFGDLIPDDVESVRSADGDDYVRDRNGRFKLAFDPAGLSGYLSASTSKPGPTGSPWFDFEFPLTEVVADA
ncbi:hypothetical protein GS451_24015 [Rhodococcus hoagii]|nr:hypothetical protein [Prescottella equi]MBM4640676.1 hypothetical protein [Prescottella equi]